MQLTRFINRSNEFRLFVKFLKSGGLAVLTGRRRIGKSRFLRKLADEHNGRYAQAIEGPPVVQLQQLWQDIGGAPATTPTTWSQFFELLRVPIANREFRFLILDEFPWLVASEPTLPSVLQKWIDDFLEKGSFSLICAGSSQRMMHANFLAGSSPLYGRASLIHRMDYLSYADYLELNNFRNQPGSFECFSVLGGVPRYWLHSLSVHDPMEIADKLFFSESALLADEPQRLLWDEGLGGLTPRWILELIGRGCHKPSEIAARLGVTQGSLSRAMEQLLSTCLIKRDVCFGDEPRTSKKILYKIADPALLFWHSIFSKNRNTWQILSNAKKKELLSLHTSTIWEEYWRKRLGGARYWEKGLELDSVSLLSEKRVLIAEIKWTKLSSIQHRHLMEQLKVKWSRSMLSQKIPFCEFRIISQDDLKALA